MSTFRTSQIAAMVHIHPNTVRLYEELGYLPPVPRARNGYRVYSRLHLAHLHLIRAALRSTWLGGAIREKALTVIRLAAAGCLAEALALQREHHALIREEKAKAELAAGYLEAWAAKGSQAIAGKPPCLRSGEVAQLLNITHDMLRSWERNGLIAIPRDPQNGYRVFSEPEIQRLYVIRALRKARFSLMSIYQMLRHYDRGERERLTGILDELPPDEEDIFFNTNQWLTKIKSIEVAAGEMRGHLSRIKELL